MSVAGNVLLETTVNVERFAALNFRVFHGFQDHESFSVNIYSHKQALYTGIVYKPKCLKCKAPQKFSREKLYWVEFAKV